MWRLSGRRTAVRGRNRLSAEDWPFRHPADPDLPPRLPAHVARDAVHKAVTEMRRTGALDAGNGDVLDPWLDSLHPQWIAHHVASTADREAAAKLAAGEYEARAVAARRRADVATTERADIQRLAAVVEQRLLEPAEGRRPGLDPLDGLTPQRGWRVVGLLLLVCAAAGDMASFSIAIAGMMDQSLLVIWVLTVAVTAAAIGVMHVIGRATRDLREGQGGLGRPAIGLMTVAWVVLGGAAFYVRLQGDQHPASAAPVFGGGTGNLVAGEEALLQALLLGALFLASGVLAFSIGFTGHHPRMQPYLSLRARLHRADVAVARAEQDALEAERLRDNAQDEIWRTAARATAAEASVDAEIAELKELARIHLAGLLGDPPSTNHLITGRTPDPAARSRSLRELGIPSPAAPLDGAPPTQSGNGHRAGAR